MAANTLWVAAHDKVAPTIEPRVVEPGVGEATKPLIGIAYRPQFRIDLFQNPASIDYLEITAEDYLDLRGRVRADLAALKGTFTIIVHALGLSIGSADGINQRYLERLAKLIEYVQPAWWSDHLGFSRVGSRDIGHFVPLRRNRESIEIVARNADAVRRVISTPFALENPTLPFVVPGGDLDHGSFLTATAEAARCRLLIDVENLHADERNFREPADAVIDRIPPQLVAEIHIAGGHVLDDVYVDSHDAPIPERTWNLAQRLVARCGSAAITLERDANLRHLGTVAGELQRARRLTQLPSA